MDQLITTYSSLLNQFNKLSATLHDQRTALSAATPYKSSKHYASYIKLANNLNTQHCKLIHLLNHINANTPLLIHRLNAPLAYHSFSKHNASPAIHLWLDHLHSYVNQLSRITPAITSTLHSNHLLNLDVLASGLSDGAQAYIHVKSDTVRLNAMYQSLSSSCSVEHTPQLNPVRVIDFKALILERIRTSLRALNAKYILSNILPILHQLLSILLAQVTNLRIMLDFTRSLSPKLDSLHNCLSTNFHDRLNSFIQQTTISTPRIFNTPTNLPFPHSSDLVPLESLPACSTDRVSLLATSIRPHLNQLVATTDLLLSSINDSSLKTEILSDQVTQLTLSIPTTH